MSHDSSTPRARPEAAQTDRPQGQTETIVTVPLELVRLDGTQSRVRTSDALISEYAAAIVAGEVLPPVELFYDGEVYWCGDGQHRVPAHAMAGCEVVDAIVRHGTQRDALLHAVGANATHGLRRSSADKRHAVELLLADPEWRQWSDHEIARRCSVSPTTVGSVRRSLSNLDGELGPTTRRYRTRHGTVSTMAVPTARAETPPSVVGGDPERCEADHPLVTTAIQRLREYVVQARARGKTSEASKQLRQVLRQIDFAINLLRADEPRPARDARAKTLAPAVAERRGTHERPDMPGLASAGDADAAEVDEIIALVAGTSRAQASDDEQGSSPGNDLDLLDEDDLLAALAD